MNDIQKFREFSSRCLLRDTSQAAKRKVETNLKSQLFDLEKDDETLHVTAINRQKPNNLPAIRENQVSTNKAYTIDGIHARARDVPDDALLDPKQQQKQANKKPSKNRELIKGEISSEAFTASSPSAQLVSLAQRDNSSKASVATKPPPRLRAFVKKAPARRRLKFESATVLMERILDNKSSEAPTSVMSIETRATVLGGLVGLRWNDKTYGYLPKFVANGKVGAVRECLKAGCNPGRKEKPRWAPVYNAIRG